ncbi:MAG: hypothetical protein VXZ96_06695 [Myxococcota bacterium]|nr:hypothetical protein [Myxococcota bacterium]
MLYLMLLNSGLLYAAEPALNLTTGLSTSRIGLSADFRYGIWQPMLEKKSSILRTNTGLKAQAVVNATPAFARVGGRVTFSPLAIVDLTAYGMADSYFGNFQTLIDYDTPDANYGTNSDIADYVDETGRQNSGRGWHMGGALTLKAKAGPIVIFLNEDVSQWRIQSPEAASGEWFFEREAEVMMSFGDEQYFNFNGLLMVENKSATRLLRVGSMTTHRQTAQAEDVLFRSGMILITGQLQKQYAHTLIVQPYIESRAMTTFPPYVAYAFRLNR